MKEEAKVGAVITLAVIFFIALILILKNVNLYESGYCLIVQCDDTAGIMKGDPVTLAGVQIGNVEEIWLEKQKVNMRIWIKDVYKIPRDSRAFIKTLSMMGEKTIGITPGVSSVILQDGQSLPGYALMDITDIAIEVKPLTESFKETLRKLSSTLDDTTTENIKQTIKGYNLTAKNLNRIIKNSEKDINKATLHLKDFSEDLSALSQSNRSQVDSIITRLEKSSTNFSEASADLTQTSNNLEDITRSIKNQKGALGRLIYDKQFSIRLDSLVINSNELLKDVKKNPDRYVKISVF